MYTVGMDLDTRAYFTVATMMDEELMTLNVNGNVRNSITGTILKVMGCFLIVLPLLGANPLKTIVEFTGKGYTNYSESYCYSEHKLIRFMPYDPYYVVTKLVILWINVSLALKGYCGITYEAGNGVTRNFGSKTKLNRKFYFYSNLRNKGIESMLVVKRNYVSNQYVLSELMQQNWTGVLEDDEKEELELRNSGTFQKGYSECILNKDDTKILLMHAKDLKMPKDSQLIMWRKKLGTIQRNISYFTSNNNLELAMNTIDEYIFHPVIRFLAVLQVKKQSGKVSGTDGKCLNDLKDIYEMLEYSRYYNLIKNYRSRVKYVEIPKDINKVRILGIGNIIDRVIQTMFLYMMDPFYEPFMHEHIYGSRKGRSSLNALGYLKSVLEKSDIGNLNVLNLDLAQCFDNFKHEYILKNVAIPFRFKDIFVKWLKPDIYMSSGAFIKKKNKGIVQGSVIGPFICKIILNNAVKNLLACNDLRLTTPQNINLSLKQRNIYRNIIVYVDDIVITTNYKPEVEFIINKFKDIISEAGLEIAWEKSKILSFGVCKVSWDYLGYTINYIPKSKIRKGGLLTRNDEITRLKHIKYEGTFLFYMCNKNLRRVISNCKNIIKTMSRFDVLVVINKVNEVLRGFCEYFSFSNNYNRLRFIEGLLNKYFRKKLIAKFRFRGIRRPRWISENFYIADGSCGPKSPYKLKWHLHIPLIRNNNNIKRFKDFIWFILPTKYYKIIPLRFMSMSRELRDMNFYLDSQPFIDFNLKLLQIRKNKQNFRDKLLVKQKGNCPECSSSLLNSHGYPLAVEIHHIQPIGEAMKAGIVTHKNSNKLSNLMLLHKECHSHITQFNKNVALNIKKGKTLKNNLVNKRCYSIRSKLQKFKNKLNKLDEIIYYILNAVFIRRFLTTLFFFISFIMLYLNLEFKNIIFVLYILVFLIYNLYLRLLKLKLYKYRNTVQNRFFYKNISVFILNILLMFSIVLYSNIESVMEFYPTLVNVTVFGEYFNLYMIFLIIILIITILSTSSLREKVEENIIEKQKWDEFVIKTEELLQLSIVNRFINKRYTRFMVIIYKKIQLLFFVSVLINLFSSIISSVVILKYLYIVITYTYLLSTFVMVPIFLDIGFLFIINLPNCFIYSLSARDIKNSLNGWGDFDVTKLVKNVKHVDNSVKKVHSLGVWSVLGTVSGIYVAYNTWHHNTYPELQSPYERHNEEYVKPVMKRMFDIPSDSELVEHGYNKETLKKDLKD